MISIERAKEMRYKVMEVLNEVTNMIGYCIEWSPSDISVELDLGDTICSNSSKSFILYMILVIDPRLTGIALLNAWMVFLYV